MMLFLPESHGRPRVKAEIFLDLYQIAIVVGLVYSTFIFLPVQHMLPADALRRDVAVSDGQSCVLMVAVFIRLQFARIPPPATFLPLVRVSSGLRHRNFCWGLDGALHHYRLLASLWFNLGWAIPLICTGLLGGDFNGIR